MNGAFVEATVLLGILIVAVTLVESGLLNVVCR